MKQYKYAERLPSLDLKECDKCWNEGPFFYHREHDHELGWSVMKRGITKPIMYGDKNLCCGVAYIMNGYDWGIDLIKDVAPYF